MYKVGAFLQVVYCRLMEAPAESPNPFASNRKFILCLCMLVLCSRVHDTALGIGDCWSLLVLASKPAPIMLSSLNLCVHGCRK